MGVKEGGEGGGRVKKEGKEGERESERGKGSRRGEIIKRVESRVDL